MEILNQKSICCFGHCCRKEKKQRNLIETKKISNEKAMKTKPLAQSEFLNESIFCGNITEIYHDPCVQLTVQDGPDLSENITRKSAKINIDPNEESKQSENDIPESYNWNLPTTSNQNFEPYNWDEIEYSIPLQDKSSSKKGQSQVNDDDETSNTKLDSQLSFSTAVLHEPVSHDHSQSPNSTHGMYNTFNQVRATYDDIIISFRYLFERFLNFMNSSKHTNHKITRDTCSWSTMISNESLNSEQFHSLGPWWGRRDTCDQMPTTFIFSDEPLMNNQQICFWNYSNCKQ